jgi:hypothetical protein
MLKSRISKLAAAVVTAMSVTAVTALSATGASAATTALPAVTAVRTSAVPDTVSSCTYGSSSGNIRTCFGIVGRGQLTAYMWMSAQVHTVGRYLHFEIIGPSFPKGINDAEGNFYAPPGSYNYNQWDFGTDLHTGKYSGILWRWLGGHSYTKVAQITWAIRS